MVGGVALCAKTHESVHVFFSVTMLLLNCLKNQSYASIYHAKTPFHALYVSLHHPRRSCNALSAVKTVPDDLVGHSKKRDSCRAGRTSFHRENAQMALCQKAKPKPRKGQRGGVGEHENGTLDARNPSNAVRVRRKRGHVLDRGRCGFRSERSGALARSRRRVCSPKNGQKINATSIREV